METISLTVPLKEGPLRRASGMLIGLAGDLRDRREFNLAALKEAREDGEKDKAAETLGNPPEVGPETIIDYIAPAGDTFTEAEVAEGDAQLAEEPATTIGQSAALAADVFGTSAEAPTVPATTEVPGVELDDEGLPWDGRIHTDKKTKLKGNNTWKLTRGVDPVLVEQVKAELLSNMSAPAATAPPEAPAATAPPATPAATEATVTTFPQLVEYVTAKCNEGVVAQGQMEEILAKHGLVGGLPVVAARPDLIPAIYAGMVALWG